MFHYQYIMRFYYFFILLLAISNLSAQAISYEEGLKNCDQVRDEINKQNEATGQTNRLQAGCLTGAMLPEFIVTTTNGKTIDHNYFIGKVTLINFWMKTCGPCISEIPGLDRLKANFGTDNVNFLAIGRTDEEETDAFLKLHPWTFDQVKNGKPLIEDIFKFGWGYPITMIINKKGEIVFSSNGGVVGDGGQIIQNRLTPLIEAELAK